MNKQDLDLVADYAKKFVDAVTPAAKQAYEAGLLTLRIDAVGELVVAFLLLLIISGSIFGSYRFCKKNDWDLDCVAMSILGNSVIGGVMMVASIWKLFSVWTWTKLLAPELWLVHQAIEKVLK